MTQTHLNLLVVAITAYTVGTRDYRDTGRVAERLILHGMLVLTVVLVWGAP